MKKHRFCLCALVLVGSLFFTTNVFAAEKAQYSFGIVPQQSAMDLAAKWIPILKYLEKETGYKFVFKTDYTIPVFEGQLAKQAYDFAYMNPYHYTVFHDTAGYSAFAMQGEKKLKGILVARKDSNINSIEDLKGLTVAFPAPAAFAATVIPQAVLKSKGINIHSKYVSSHESVYKNVAYKNFVVGGGIERTFENTAKEITDPLKVIWTSKGFTPHAFASSPKIPEEVKIKVQKALLKMSSTEAGKQLLQAIKFKKVISAQNADWDDVRALDINLIKDLASASAVQDK